MKFHFIIAMKWGVEKYKVNHYAYVYCNAYNKCEIIKNWRTELWKTFLNLSLISHYCKKNRKGAETKHLSAKVTIDIDISGKVDQVFQKCWMLSVFRTTSLILLALEITADRAYNLQTQNTAITSKLCISIEAKNNHGVIFTALKWGPKWRTDVEKNHIQGQPTMFP